MTNRTLLASLCVLLSSVGCGPPVEPDGTPGALREGGFVYCDPSGACGYSDPIPDPIAVGSRFFLSYSDGGDLVSTNEDRLQVVPSNSPTRDPLGTEFEALAAGAATVQVRSFGAADELIDFVPIHLAEPSSLRVDVCARVFNAIAPEDAFLDLFDSGRCAGKKATDPLVISRGEELAPTVCAVPVDRAGSVMGGLLPVMFDASGEAELELNPDAGPRCATIGGLTLGTAKVTVTSGKTTVSFTVEVKP